MSNPAGVGAGSRPTGNETVARGGISSKSKLYHVAFLAAIMASFVVPLVIPGLGISLLSTFTVAIILLAWASLKWNALASLSTRARPWEAIIGAALVLADYAENFARGSSLGLVDMLVVFVGLWVAFYGVRHVRFFLLPSFYVAILIAGYVIEYNIPSIAGLEYFIASLMNSMLLSLGMKATVFMNTVTIYTPSPVFLQVDGPCTGLQGILAFGLLASMAVIDVRTSRRRLALVLAIGLIGAFLINFVRLAMVFLSFEFLGSAIGAEMHAYMGYLLFLAWVLVFWNFAFKYLSKSPRLARVGTGTGL